MKTLTVNRKIAVSVGTVMLLICGVQDISYGQDGAPAIAPGENNSSLLVRFEVSLDRDDANAYQIQLRRETPRGEWISKCIAIERISEFATGDLGVTARPKSVWHVFSFVWSSTEFYVSAIFADLEPGTTYEARYRDTNLSACGETPPAPDPWSGIGEETTHLVPPPRVEFVNANLARAVRKELSLATEGGHIDLLKIPEAELVRLTELDASESEIIDLSPLAQLTQLTDLDLSGNQISDLSPLAQLTQLTDLDLSGNQISDVNSLTSLLSLRSLSLRRNPITDISPLSKLASENPKLVLYIDIPIIITKPDGETDSYLSIYWIEKVSSFDSYILQGDLAKTDIHDLVTQGLSSPKDIALDVTNGKIYWTNRESIWCANLDGTDVQAIVSELNRPISIALDVAGSKMYWTDEDTGIVRANLDGTDIQAVVTGLRSPTDIALDVAGGKMYWADEGSGSDSGKIQRANFDGTDVQAVVTGLTGAPIGIALDVTGGKMYWTERSRGKIQRANFDGTDVRAVVTGLRSPTGIALDVVGGKMYWADEGAGKIQCANLDGTDVRDVVIGLDLGLTASIALNSLSSAIVQSQPTALTSPVVEQQLVELSLKNAPNPFNSETIIFYYLPKPGLARLEVFALTGQQVVVLYQGLQQAGYHRLHWDARDSEGRLLASGIYLCRLAANEAVLTRKLTLLR